MWRRVCQGAVFEKTAWSYETPPGDFNCFEIAVFKFALLLSTMKIAKVKHGSAPRLFSDSFFASKCDAWGYQSLSVATAEKSEAWPWSVTLLWFIFCFKMGRGGYRRLLLVTEAKSRAWPWSVTIFINFWLQNGMRRPPKIFGHNRSKKWCMALFRDFFLTHFALQEGMRRRQELLVIAETSSEASPWSVAIF